MQPIYNSSEKEPIYSKLKDFHKLILDNSYTWNWETLSCLTTPGIRRLLHLNEIYELILDLPGDIFEFGCHFGASTAILNNLKNIYEPHSSRKINTFDTFEGFPEPDDTKDKSKSNFKNNRGDYGIEINEYQKILEQILILQEKLYSSLSSQRSFTINKGLIENSLPEFFKNNPSTFISLVIFDMDLYHPTLKSLETIEPNLLVGSILVFDEILCFDQYPGESYALRNCSFRERLIPIKKSRFVPGSCIFRYE